MSEAIVIHVRKILQAREAEWVATMAEVEKLEAAGCRIITGGQTGRDTWDIVDWRTDEIIAEGGGGLDGYAKAHERLNPEGTWHHMDPIAADIMIDPAPTEGVPPSLAQALEDWIGQLNTPDDEIAQVVGWSEDDVARCRQDS